MFDHPFEWGSKRTGPDLARVGGRNSDEWHVDHLMDPQSVAPESIMPKYAFLADAPVDAGMTADLVAIHAMVGVPNSEGMIAQARADFHTQTDPFGDVDGLLERYPGAQVRNFDGQPGTSEIDALIAGGFAIVIAVNVTLAYSAVRTFPGLEVESSYIASQTFDDDRKAQDALGGDVVLRYESGTLRLAIVDAAGSPVKPVIAAASLGRAATVADDRQPDFA